MSHLVELLRTPTGAKPPTKWELQAADRIEALEAALRKIAHPDNCLSRTEVERIAHAALDKEC